MHLGTWRKRRMRCWYLSKFTFSSFGTKHRRCNTRTCVLWAVLTNYSHVVLWWYVHCVPPSFAHVTISLSHGVVRLTTQLMLSLRSLTRQVKVRSVTVAAELELAQLHQCESRGQNCSHIYFGHHGCYTLSSDQSLYRHSPVIWIPKHVHSPVHTQFSQKLASES